MSKPDNDKNVSFGRQIIDQLTEQLAKAKRARAAESNRSGGTVINFSNQVNNDSLSEDPNHNHKFSSQELQLLLLNLLVDRVAPGYELIKALETLSNGFYSPGPGMVYPALTYLDELGHISVTLDGTRKSYSLSGVGKQYLTKHQPQVDAAWLKLTKVPRRDFVHGKAEDNEYANWTPELIEARRSLQQVLAQRSNAPVSEQRRITEVLLQAARAISGK